MVVEGALEKLPLNNRASSELQGIVKRLDISHQLTDECIDISRIIDGRKFIRKFML